MAGFRKAAAEKAALKMALYGPTGSGKTLTALMVAEGLAALRKGRVAMIDTERGTDFYCQEVPERAAHPAAFDFDRLETRSLTEALKACRESRPEEHPVVVIDSVTHLWEAARAAYTGRTTRAGSIPMQAWGQIKKPWKELMHWMLATPQHVLLCGRQGNDWSEGDGGELVLAGVKMKAEGETAYEPDVLLRLEARPLAGRKGQGAKVVHLAHVEKDRTGKLPACIEWPSFDTLARPLLGLLGERHAAPQSEDDAAALDHEALARQGRETEAASQVLLGQFMARIAKAKGLKDLNAVGLDIKARKAGLLTPHVAQLEAEYRAAMQAHKDAAAKAAPAAEADPAEEEERKAIRENGGG